MLVKDMIKAIENKELNVDDICSHFGISDRTYQNKMKPLGFKWDSKACKYNFIGTDKTVYEMAIGDVFKKGSRNAVKKEIKNASEEIASTVQNEGENTPETASKITSKRTHKKGSDNIDRLLAGKKAKKEYRGFYLDSDVLGIIDNVDSGIKSELVNECLRKVFKEKGLL